MLVARLLSTLGVALFPPSLNQGRFGGIGQATGGAVSLEVRCLINHCGSVSAVAEARDASRKVQLGRLTISPVEPW